MKNIKKRAITETYHIGRVLNAITTKNLPKILSTVHDFFWFTIRKGIEGVRKLSFYRGQFVYFDIQKIALHRRNVKQIIHIGTNSTRAQRQGTTLM